jgi:hypothetical protein
MLATLFDVFWLVCEMVQSLALERDRGRRKLLMFVFGLFGLAFLCFWIGVGLTQGLPAWIAYLSASGVFLGSSYLLLSLLADRH